MAAQPLRIGNAGQRQVLGKIEMFAKLAVKQAQRQLQVELAKLGLTEVPGRDFDVATVPTVVQARVTLERAKQNFNRERSLMKRGAGTTQDLQNTENDEKAAEAALASAFEAWRRELGARLLLFTTGAGVCYLDHAYRPGDILMFGRETAGVPEAVHQAADARLVIPMREGLRSLNVAVAAAIAVGEALRQTGGFAGH